MRPSATDARAGIHHLSPMATFDWRRGEVSTRTRAGRPYSCGASPHWSCSQCMDGHEGAAAADGACADPTYAPAPAMNANPMCQFNGTES